MITGGKKFSEDFRFAQFVCFFFQATIVQVFIAIARYKLSQLENTQALIAALNNRLALSSPGVKTAVSLQALYK